MEKPCRLAPAVNVYWPETLRQLGAVTIRFVAGYSDPTVATTEAAQQAAVPENFKHAIKLLIGHFYDNPNASTPQSLAELPLGVDYLLENYRLSWVA